MKLEQYIYFEEGEKQKLVDIMNNNVDEWSQNIAIQEAFKLDLLQSEEIIRIYNKRIKK